MTNLSRVESLADVCESVSKLNSKYGHGNGRKEEVALTAAIIIQALDGFMECVRYLNTRRSEAAILKLDSEAAVQDALYLMLRPWISDLVPETPTERIASRYTIRDFFTAQAQTVIEAKFIRDKEHGKQISKELHDDIETYRNHHNCKHLIFFIYDPDVLIPDRAALERQICFVRSYDGVQLSCYLVVKP